MKNKQNMDIKIFIRSLKKILEFEKKLNSKFLAIAPQDADGDDEGTVHNFIYLNNFFAGEARKKKRSGALSAP